MNDATDTTRSSRRSMCSSESATNAVFSVDEPVGRKISTANWLRSATGSIFCGSFVIMPSPATIDTAAMANVTYGWRKQAASARS